MDWLRVTCPSLSRLAHIKGVMHIGPVKASGNGESESLHLDGAQFSTLAALVAVAKNGELLMFVRVYPAEQECPG